MIGLEILDEFLKNGFAESLTVKVVSLRLVLAVIFGGMVGYTRERNNKPAGFRTHTGMFWCRYNIDGTGSAEIEYYGTGKSKC